MKNVINRILSLFLSLAFIAGMVLIPIPMLEAKAETANLAGTLGDEWSVGWNGSDIPADEFVKIVTEQKYMGGYSLRIGHPQEETKITLKLQIPVTSVEAYQYAVWAKAVGTVNSVKFYARDGADGLGEGNILEYDITDKLSETWTQFKNIDNATEEDTNGSATELTVDSGVFCIDIGVSLPSSSYLYLDNLDVVTSAKTNVPLYNDNSFERLTITNKAASGTESYNYNASEFVQVVSDDIAKSNTNGGTKALRIGHETMDTNITMTYYAPLPTDWKIGAKNYRNSFYSDYYIKLPKTVDTKAEDFALKDYLSTAKITFSGYPAGTKSDSARSVLLTRATNINAWTSIVADDYYCEKTTSTHSGKAGYFYQGSSGGYLYETFTISCKAGVYLYLDNFNIYYNQATSSNLFADPGFESLDLEPSAHILREQDLPYPWTRTWDENYNTTDYYITPDSSEGTQALAISSKTEEISHTVANTITGLEVGKSYTVEATFKKTGKLTNANIFFNDGTANVTIIDIDANATSSYKTVSGTFTPTASDTELNVYVNAPKGSTLIIDNIKVYATDDTAKTNLIVNGGFEPYTPPTEHDYFDGTLGEEWTCLDNGSNTDYTKFVDVTRNQAYNGNYAMKIGYAYADTDITLRYKKAVENGEYTYSAYLTSTDTPLAGSCITLKDGENGTSVESALTDLTESWTNYTGTVTVTNGELIIDIKAALKAGKYIYIDYMNIVNTSAPANQINTDASFERFIVKTNNADGDYEDSDFLNIVDDKASNGNNSLRIGNENVATNIVVEYIVPIIDNETGRSTTFRFAGDVFFDGDTTNSKSYIRYGVLDGPNWRQINLSSITGKEWVSVSNANQITPNGEAKTGGPYLYGGTNFYTVRFVVKCNAGEYLYIDNLNVYNTKYTSNNLLADPSFENYDLKTTVFTTDTSLTSALTIPSNWYVSWNSNISYRYDYRSNEAHSGDYALAITAKEKKMGHTFKQSISKKVEVGAEYTLEGYFKKVGTFSAVSLMETASGDQANVTFMKLKDVTMNDYTFVSATFTARSGSGFNIYTVSTADSLLLVDDLKIYKSDDETKTNILENGGFENWKSSYKEQYRVKKTFNEAPKTFEATVKLPTDFAADESAGVIVGNYNGKDESFNLEVTTNGNPRVYIRDTDGKSYDLVFDTVDLRTGEWTQISAVKNTSTIDLYINGELSASKDFTATFSTNANPYALSGDNITVEKRYAFTYNPSSEITNPNYFKGEIKNVAFYDDANNLIASYNLCHTLDPEVIADETNNGYYALRYGNFIRELQAEDDDETAYPYSFVAVGDTQYVCERDKKKGTNDMTYIYDWIVNNKETKNIKFVMGLGDITDENTVEEYAVAAKHLQKLNDAGIPQSIIRGNHDGPNQKVMDLYDECLKDVIEATPYDGIMTAPVFDETGNLVSGTYDNMYYTVEVGEQKWLIFAFGYQPTSEILSWAGEIIEQHSDYNVIVTTHGYINGKLEIPNDARKRIWDELGCKYENIKLILCGDCNDVDLAVQKKVGINGNVVTEMLIDRQNIDQAAAYGHVTLLRFSPDGQKIKIEDFAAVKEKYFRPSNQFIIDISDEANANDAALFNFEDRLGRNGLYDNKDLEMQSLLTELKANIANAEGTDAINTAYNTAVSAITAPAAPSVALEGRTATITATDGYEYSMDGINWQDSPVFTNLPIDTTLSFYQRQSAAATGYTSFTSNATLCMIVTAVPEVMVGETSIHVKAVDGYEYSIDNATWQTSTVFNNVVNGNSYTVYMRPVGTDGYTLLLNGTTVTVNGNEPVYLPSATDLVNLRTALLQRVATINVSYDYNGDFKVDVRDLVRAKKMSAEAVKDAETVIAALEAGENVTLDSDILLDDATVTIPANSEAILDLNGYTMTVKNSQAKASCAITNKGSLTITNGTVTYESAQPDPTFGYGTNTITNSGNLVIDGATVINTTNGGSSNAIDNAPGATLIVNSGVIKSEKVTIRLRDGSTATINGGEISGARAVQIHLFQNVAADTKLTINGGTFTGEFALYSYAYGNVKFDRTTVEITGGTFNGYVAFGGGNKEAVETVTITGGTFNSDLGRYLANDGWEDIAKPESADS